VHRSGGLLVLELLRVQGGPRPLTFTDAYRRAQSRMAELHETSGYAELLAAAAQQVQALTGFDRVMIYRFDADDNGQVVAEQRRDDLEPFLGLHYPATDIPAQARALYERNWIRLLADVDAEPAALLPRDNPRTGEPLDLGQAWLRAISPVHIQYLRNMGVTASMSVSLLRDGRLWGLIACHHYSGPHEPPYEVCVTAEMLGQILSARLVDAAERERARREVDARAALAQLVAASHTTTSLAVAVTSGDVGIADLLPCTGALARVEGQTATAGAELDPAVVQRIDAAFAGQELFWTETLADVIGDAAPDPAAVSGVLGVRLGDDQLILWLRPQQAQAVHWGGNPNEKTVERGADGAVTIGPRRSFARWREEAEGRSAAWSDDDRADARRLRGYLVDILYRRAREAAEAALELQLSLLPGSLPDVAGFTLAARYLPAAEDAVGGDWYDAIRLPSGGLVLVVGDASGHGLAAAGTMGQLRSAVRAYALTEPGPAAVIRRLHALVDELMPISFASCVVACVDPADGEVYLAAAGHPPAVTAGRAGTRALQTWPYPPLGAPFVGDQVRETSFRLEPGDALLLYSDGLIERREEPLDTSIARLLAAAAAQTATPTPEGLQAIVDRCRDPRSGDDATLLVLRRDD
jgi:GAF domain-containing protein